MTKRTKKINNFLRKTKFTQNFSIPRTGLFIINLRLIWGT